jgi:hypothetical protein
MVKLQIGASIFHCDTAEEAYRIHRMDTANSGGSITVSNGISVRATPNGNGGGSSVGREFLKKLEPFAGKELNSEQFMEIVDAKSTYALGPVLRQIRKSLEVEGLSFDSYVVKQKPDPETPTSWAILKHEQCAT